MKLSSSLLSAFDESGRKFSALSQKIKKSEVSPNFGLKVIEVIEVHHHRLQKCTISSAARSKPAKLTPKSRNPSQNKFSPIHRCVSERHHTPTKNSQFSHVSEFLLSQESSASPNTPVRSAPSTT
jgi:hypothetical protein